MRLLRKALNTGVEVALCNISSFDVQFFYTTCYLFIFVKDDLIGFVYGHKKD